MINNSDSSSYPVKTGTLHKANVGPDGYIAGRADVPNRSPKKLEDFVSGSFRGLVYTIGDSRVYVSSQVQPSTGNNKEKDFLNIARKCVLSMAAGEAVACYEI